MPCPYGDRFADRFAEFILRDEGLRTGAQGKLREWARNDK